MLSVSGWSWRRIIPRAKRGSQDGLTFVEMIATAAIMLILASAIMPLARVTIVRQREIELRRALRDVRDAIDEYHMMAQAGQICPTDLQLDAHNYPQKLDQLVEGVCQVGKIDLKHKFLRRIPVDPMTNSTEWGLRCYQDDADDRSWCGDNVWDVYTKSDGKALDGSEYKDW